MASICLGIATSHSPILTLPGHYWQHRAQADVANPRLSLADGRFVTYDQLVAERGEPFGDVAVCKDVADPAKAGFGHAFGFPVERLFRGREIPIIPILLNTYYPPNVLSPKRCLAIGAALAEAIENSPSAFRVAVLASGGLSHFVVEEELDRAVIDNLERPDKLREVAREALLEGSSEILNWILTAGAMAGHPVRWREYEAVRRTPAGTGIGLGFAVWSREAE